MNQYYSSPSKEPIEPEGKKRIRKQDLFKWLLFLFAIIYILLSYYHAPILTSLGRFLIVEHPPQKSDLIVCLAGGNVDRGLAAAGAYNKGLAPRVFITREELPDGYGLLKEKGVNYPESVELLIIILEGLGVPRSAILLSDGRARSTIEEAEGIREVVKEKGYRSLIIITSPTHTKRAWLTYKKVFEGGNVRILMRSSPYSKFRPEDWWKKRRYVRDVIIEYEKLIFYVLKYLL